MTNFDYPGALVLWDEAGKMLEAQQELEFLIFAVDELHHERCLDMEYEDIAVRVCRKLTQKAKAMDVEVPIWWGYKAGANEEKTI